MVNDLVSSWCPLDLLRNNDKMVSNIKCWYGCLILVTIAFCIISYIHINRIRETPIFTSRETNTTNLPSSKDDALNISVSKNASTNNVVVLVKPTRDSYQNGSSKKEAGRVITGYKSDSKASQTWKVILLYTKWWSVQWPDASNWMKNKTKCQFKCRFTTNKHDLVMSDAVMFHGPHMPDNVQHLKSIRIPKQIWLYFTMENPYYNSPGVARFNGLFNWTMTFRRDSDLYLPYGKFQHISESKSKDQIITNYGKEKTRLIAWAVSHCNTTGKRDEFVQEFSKFVPVSIYGRCRGLFPKRDNINEASCPYSTRQCTKRLRKFKFYLALENAMCLDYITEKYWITLGYNIVPIVIGPQYYAELAIPGSYINALDFPSIEALANYIKYLDKNDTAYNEYFRWKSKYEVYETEWGGKYLCNVCKKLHTGTKAPKVYKDLGSFWSKTYCTRHLSLLDKFWKYN